MFIDDVEKTSKEDEEIKKDIWKMKMKKKIAEKMKMVDVNQNRGIDTTSLEEEIENLSKTKAKAALVPFGVNIDGFTTIEVESNKVTSLLSSSDTDSQYPSARAVYNTLKDLFSKYGTVD